MKILVSKWLDLVLHFIETIIDYRSRVQGNASLQKEWIKEQKREHQWEAENLKAEESAYAAQTEAITRARGMMEDDMTMKKQQQL